MSFSGLFTFCPRVYDPRQNRSANAGGNVILDKIIFYLLLALLVLTPLPYGTVETWSTAIWELIVLVIALLWGGHALLQKRLAINISPLVWPMLAVLVIAGVQLIPFTPGARATITFDSFATLDAGIKWFIMILFFLLFCTFVNTDERRQRAVTTIIVLAVMIALIGIGQSYLGKIIWPRANAGFGPFVNRNHFAGFLEMAAGLAGARILSRTIQREKLMLYVCYLIVICSGLILSASRGGFLSLGGVVIFLAIAAVPPRKETNSQPETDKGLRMQLIAASILLIFLAAGAMFLTSSDELLQRFSTTAKQETKENELADTKFSRRDLWETTGRIIKDHPILGTGLGAYQFVYTHYDRSSGILRAEQSHNDYLQIVVDTGIIGGLAALAFIVLLFGKGFSGLQTTNLARRAVTAGALAGCFGIAVHSFVDFNLQVTNNAQLFLALAALATTQPSQMESKEKTHQEVYWREQLSA